MLQYITIIGALVWFLGICIYIKDTLKGITKPNRITWLGWSIPPMIATIVAFSSGVQWSTLPVFMTWFWPFLVFLASFVNKQSYWKLGVPDYLCWIFSLLALILWYISKDPVIAIIFAIIGDAFAAIPTIKKAWAHPETETMSTYASTIFMITTSFLALRLFTFTELAFPIYLLFTSCTLVILIWRHKWFHKKNNTKSLLI